jgi:hypothetical protein
MKIVGQDDILRVDGIGTLFERGCTSATGR